MSEYLRDRTIVSDRLRTEITGLLKKGWTTQQIVDKYNIIPTSSRTSPNSCLVVAPAAIDALRSRLRIKNNGTNY